MALGLSLSASGCATAPIVEIPASLKTPCVSTVDVSGAQTVGDLGRAVIQQDAEIAICSVKKDAVISIAESGKRRFWFF